MRKEHVILHDVAGDFAEGAQVTRLSIDENLSLHACLSEIIQENKQR